MTHPITRRQAIARTALASAAAVCAPAALVSCRTGSPGETVVLYSSVDSWLLKELTVACERETGLRLSTVGDTEATKTTGLVTRLLAERDAPRADVWWSSEPFGSVALAREGVLAPATIEPAESAFEGGWPAHLRAQDKTWYAFALRARVLAYSPERVGAQRAPRTLEALTAGAWQGRVGIAQPQFGTTRGHLGALHAAWGADRLTDWCERMRANDLRVYDGNATVVRKIAEGEIDIGLTDTDDVRAAAESGLDVAMVYEAIDDEGVFPSFGPMVIPNTAGLVAGGPNPDAGRRLLGWLLSGAAERLLASSASGNYPVHPQVAREFPDLQAPQTAMPPLAAADAGIDPALAIWESVFA